MASEQLSPKLLQQAIASSFIITMHQNLATCCKVCQ